jgi:hypothetical protein
MASVWGKARLDVRDAHLCECCHGLQAYCSDPIFGVEYDASTAIDVAHDTTST